MVNYPYDDDKEGATKYSKAPDDAVFQQVSRAYSQVRGRCVSTHLLDCFDLRCCPLNNVMKSVGLI